jgi:hypothetical protein
VIGEVWIVQIISVQLQIDAVLYIMALAVYFMHA